MTGIFLGDDPAARKTRTLEAERFMGSFRRRRRAGAQCEQDEAAYLAALC